MPLPNPFIFPSPYLLPGGPGPFSDLLLDALSPWADQNWFWNTYNGALGTLFEPVYDIVADTGDPNQTVVAILSADLSTAAPITQISVQAVSRFMEGGQEVSVAIGRSLQTFTLSESVAAGNTTIFVEPATPNYPYPIGSPVQLVYVPGWSVLLNPVDCPDQFLPFLGQFVGADIPIGLDATTARTKITDESAQHRGTLVSLRSAVQRNLTGTQSVVIQERLNNLGNAAAYHVIIIIRPEELVNLQALTNDVNLTKPGGIQWTLVQTDGWIISQMEASEATLGAVEADFVTLTGLEQDQAGT